MITTLILIISFLIPADLSKASAYEVPDEQSEEIAEIRETFLHHARNGDVETVNKFLDRMFEIAGSDTSGTLYAQAMLKQAVAYEQFQQFSKAMEQLNETYEHAGRHGHDTVAYRAAITMAQLSRKMGKSKESHDYAEIARTYSHVYNNSTLDKVKLYMMDGSFLTSIGNFTEAFDLYSEAIRDVEELTAKEPGRVHTTYLSVLYNNMGMLLTDIHQNDQALRYFAKARELTHEMNDYSEFTRNLNNTSIVYTNMGDHERAAELLRESLEINQRIGRTMSVIQNLYNLGLRYNDTEQYDEGIAYFEEGLQKSKEAGVVAGVMHHKFGLGQAHARLGNIAEARMNLEESNRLAEEGNVKYILSNSNYELYKLEKEIGNYEKALSHHENFKELDDEYKELARNSALDDLMIQHRVDYTRSQNEFLSRRLELEEAANRNMMISIAVLGFLLMLIVGLAYYFFETRRKLQFAYKSLEQQKKSISFKNQKLERIGRERNALLRVIVHDLKNPISTIDGASQILKASDNGLGRLSIEDEQELVDIISNSTKRLNLLISSLLNAFQNENLDISKEVEQVEVDHMFTEVIDEYKPLAEQKSMSINHDLQAFKISTHPESIKGILSNLLSNAIKYSEPYTQVYIELNHHPKYWDFRVRDEGPGFTDTDKVNMFKMFSRLSASPTGDETSTGVGLFSVKMSVERLGGTVELNPDYHNGAEFVCRFPYIDDIREETPKKVAQMSEAS